LKSVEQNLTQYAAYTANGRNSRHFAASRGLCSPSSRDGDADSRWGRHAPRRPRCSRSSSSAYYSCSTAAGGRLRWRCHVPHVRRRERVDARSPPAPRWAVALVAFVRAGAMQSRPQVRGPYSPPSPTEEETARSARSWVRRGGLMGRRREKELRRLHRAARGPTVARGPATALVTRAKTATH